MNALRRHLLEGQVIPALPLALDGNRRWSERHQRALIRYYNAAGTGGLAIGVHSTQFEIRDPQHGLFRPLLEFAAAVVQDCRIRDPRPYAKIAGLCGRTAQATAEAEWAAGFGYDAGLLSLAAYRDAEEDDILDHCWHVAEVLPLIGFYLQAAVGGRAFSYSFWRRFAEIPNVVAVKVAPFNRYQTWDVVRAVIDAGRQDVALYTGNDDNIIADLLTPWRWRGETRYMAGGLLGQWGVWTRRAVELLREIKAVRASGVIPSSWLTRNAELTDANAAIFDAANGFAGCIPGIHEILRRQGLMETIHCLDPHEALSPGQAAELDRVCQAHGWLQDREFVEANRDSWLGNGNAAHEPVRV